MAATTAFGVTQPGHPVCVEDEAFTGGLKVRILAWER